MSVRVRTVLQSIAISLALVAMGLAGCAADGDLAPDEDVDSTSAAVGPGDGTDWGFCYPDADRDGHGAVGSRGVRRKLPCPVSMAENDNSDCDDHNRSFWTYFYFADSDHDGFGRGSLVESCSATPPAGASTNADDCNDGDANTFPRSCLQDDDGDGNWTAQTRCVAACPALPQPQVSASFATQSTMANEPIRFSWNISAPPHCRLRVNEIKMGQGYIPEFDEFRGGLLPGPSSLTSSGSIDVTPHLSRVAGQIRASCDSVPGVTVSTTSIPVYRTTTRTRPLTLFGTGGGTTGDGYIDVSAAFNGDGPNDRSITTIQNTSGKVAFFHAPPQLPNESTPCEGGGGGIRVAPGEFINMAAIYGRDVLPVIVAACVPNHAPWNDMTLTIAGVEEAR